MYPALGLPAVLHLLQQRQRAFVLALLLTTVGLQIVVVAAIVMKLTERGCHLDAAPFFVASQTMSPYKLSPYSLCQSNRRPVWRVPE